MSAASRVARSGRRRAGAPVLAIVAAFASLAFGSAHAAAMTVYKTATCGCCREWVEHVRAAGFEVTVEDVSHAELIERKRELGIDPRLGACHTALVGGYIVEGHVPADDIRRLLAERPPVAGIAVPGMPLGSPGMEYGGRRDPYNVIAFDEAGGLRIFSRYGQ